MRRLVWGLGFLMVARMGLACECSGQAPCGKLKTGSDVFVGQVVAKRLVSLHTGDAGFGGWRDVAIYTVRVVESFSAREPVGQTVEVRSGVGGADCSYLFKTDRTYLIDAEQDRTALWTSLCSRTGEIKDREVALREFRMLAKRQRLPDLTGQLFRSTANIFWPGAKSPERMWEEIPMAGARVVLEEQGGGRLEATTDAEGIYRFDKVNQGRYRVTLQNLPTELRSGGTSLNWYDKNAWVDIAGGGAACHVYLEAVPAGRIGGRVSAAALRKDQSVEVRALRRDGLLSEVISEDFPEADGSFSFVSLAGGRYQIDLKDQDKRRVGSPVVVDLKDGEQVSGVVVGRKKPLGK